MQRFRRGLVVGKFAPLHLGHELVIRRALAACEQVVVLSWSRPELPGCDPTRRERWLAARFPAVTRLVATDGGLAGTGLRVPDNAAPEPEQREFAALLCRDVLRVEVDAVFTSEAYGDGLAAHLTAFFRRSNPAAPEVAHVCVDPERTVFPTSGTRIRSSPADHLEWLAPEVRACFVRRVCLLGGESSGKSSLAHALARALGTEHVPEYGRELWEERGGALVPGDMLEIARRQVEREEAAAQRARGVLFCDTSPLTTLFYSRELFGWADPELERLAARPYDLHVLCAPDFPFAQDGTRQGDAFRALQHDWYLRELGARGLAHVLATGPLAARVRQIASLAVVTGAAETISSTPRTRGEIA